MFKDTIEKLYPEMKAIREDLHRHPEISYKEERTCAFIMEKLQEYGCDEIKRVFDTGVVALIKGELGEGRCLALRADIDALPVTEETGVDFASENPGVMHACGHDIHTAGLLFAARLLCMNKDKFKGTVKLIFQPAEEACNPSDTRGGAKPMVWNGCMEEPHVDAIVAFHVEPSAEKEIRFACKTGVITSGFDIYSFNVHGTTAHGSQPHKGHDAILAISQFITMLQQVVSRNIDPLKTAILSVGTLQGGTRVNIIPDEASAGGCFRYYDNDTAEVIYESTLAVAKGVEVLSGCTVEVERKQGYACVDNDPELVDTVLDAIGRDNVVMMDEAASGSEDFSAYNQLTGTPCAYLWLRTPSIVDGLYALHSSKCILSSEAIKYAADAFTSIAVHYLNKF